jgi:hypothetical protein
MWQTRARWPCAQDAYPDMPSVVSELSPFDLARARENLRYWCDLCHPGPAGRCGRHGRRLPADARRGPISARRVLRHRESPTAALAPRPRASQAPLTTARVSCTPARLASRRPCRGRRCCECTCSTSCRSPRAAPPWPSLRACCGRAGCWCWRTGGRGEGLAVGRRLCACALGWVAAGGPHARARRAGGWRVVRSCFRREGVVRVPTARARAACSAETARPGARPWRTSQSSTSPGIGRYRCHAVHAAPWQPCCSPDEVVRGSRAPVSLAGQLSRALHSAAAGTTWAATWAPCLRPRGCSPTPSCSAAPPRPSPRVSRRE